MDFITVDGTQFEESVERHLFGGENRPPSLWTGDPPHEPAGWFSVYDTDTSTNEIITAHAAAVQALR